MKAKDLNFQKRPLSYSSMKHFEQSPAHFIEYLTGERVVKEAYALGNFVDCMLFDGEEEVKKRFVIKPKFGRKKEDLEEKAKWEVENEKKTWIKEEVKEQGLLMVEALQNNPLSKRIIDHTSVTQEKIVWADKKTGLPIIQYTDGRGEFEDDNGRKRPFIWDLKTTIDASDDKFSRDAYNYGYHLQAGIYLEGYVRKNYTFPEFYHVVVEKTPPFGVNVFLASSDFITLGKQQCRKILDEIAYCIKEDKFNESYEFRASNGLYNTLDLPGYAKQKLD